MNKLVECVPNFSEGRDAAVIRGIRLLTFGPGSIVSRERPALAVARLVAPYQVPVVVVTNG